MNVCDVCCEKFNKVSRKEVRCLYCHFKSCRICCQKYILSSFDDPHCMKCKHNWNREFIDSFCTKAFRNTDYRKHREGILFEREKALMPATQPEVERILNMRRLRKVLRAQKEKLIELHHRFNTYEFNPNTPIPNELRELYRNMETVYRQLEELRSQGTTIDIETRKFVRQCPKEECKGFLTEEWFCGLCDAYYCKKCSELIHSDHECDPETVKTMELLNKDSKSCPKCGTVIHKSSGCQQMWCVNCHTAFNWRTGEIEMGRIHNPHFIEFKKKQYSSREHGDIPCGGIPTFRELREVHAPNIILSFSMIVNQIERDLLFLNTGPADNLNFRIAYMLNDVDEHLFKTYLQRQEKFFEKTKDVAYIYELVANTCGDLLRQYVLEPERGDEIILLLRKILEYGNTNLELVRSRYNCTLPKNIML